MSTLFAPDGSPLRVGTVFGIGRNYAAHAAELGNSVPDAPMIFLKAASSVVGPGAEVPLPAGAASLHHEVELVALITQPLSRATPADALAAVGGWAVGIDWTDRPLQNRLKNAGHPWAAAKSFRGASCVSGFIPTDKVPDPQAVQLRLRVNGELRQDASTALMLHNVADLLSFLSINHDLQPGDLVFTGTPEGVGPVLPGDRVEAELVGLCGATFTVCA